jgi:hypothetical protein
MVTSDPFSGLIGEENQMEKETKLDIVVTYPAARDDLKETGVSREETLGQLKTRVLIAFELTEGTGPDGTVTSYVFYHDKQKLEDLNRTLGQIAGEKDTLHLKLAQQVIYG